MELNSLFRWNHLTLLNCYENEIETILIVSIIIFLLLFPLPFQKCSTRIALTLVWLSQKKGVVSYSIIKGSCFKKEKKFGTYGKLNFERFNFEIIHGWPLTTNRDDSMQLSSEIARSNPWFGRSQRKQACFFSAIDPNYFHATR